MTIPAGVFLSRPFSLLQQYDGGELFANGIISGQVVLRWANTFSSFAVGEYVSFIKTDATEMRKNGVVYYLIDESKILFSFTVS